VSAGEKIKENKKKLKKTMKNIRNQNRTSLFFYNGYGFLNYSFPQLKQGEFSL